MDKKSFKVFFLLLSLIIISTVVLVGCKSESRKIEETTNKLYKEKKGYIENTSQIESILSKLELPKGYQYKSCNIVEEEDPHSIMLNFEADIDIVYDENIFDIHSAIFFSLVENLDEIVYSRQPEGVEGIESYDRSIIDSFTLAVLDKSTRDLGASKENFKELIEFYQEYIVEKTGWGHYSRDWSPN